VHEEVCALKIIETISLIGVIYVLFSRGCNNVRYLSLYPCLSLNLLNIATNTSEVAICLFELYII
jgi:hypothetical protein